MRCVRERRVREREEWEKDLKVETHLRFMEDREASKLMSFVIKSCQKTRYVHYFTRSKMADLDGGMTFKVVDPIFSPQSPHAHTHVPTSL